MILKISAKSSDSNDITVINQDGDIILDVEGYLPEIHKVCNGDYIFISIDTETGKIVGWNEQSKKDFENFVNGNEEDE